MSTHSRKSSRSSKVEASSTAASGTAAKTTTTKRSQSPSKRSQTSDHATEPDRKAPRTPPRQSASISKSTDVDDARIVTPATSSALAQEKKSAKKATTAAAKSNARRSLSMASSPEKKSAKDKKEPEKEEKEGAGAANKKKLPFGGNKKPIEIPDNVQRVYQIAHKHTGSIGGNGHGGAIYGELTTGSMQKMTNFMIEHTGLSKDSRFIDVGCGLGKPNLHVAQYPGVDFSYGIEMEHVRWMLGIANLHQVVEAAKKDEVDGKEAQIGHSCYFAHGDITEANFFDPFTHVYMFDIGFPPRLFHLLAEMFNKSQSEYLICYHGPKLMIEDYGFDIELIVQTPTSMHGSAEGHTGYIYRRSEDCKPSSSKSCKTKQFGVPCDPLFAKAWEMCRAGLDAVCKHSSEEMEKHMGISKKRVTRSSSRKSSFVEEKKTE
ncbi:hypothetical protein ACHAXR_009016 [Thalassiosira sp. AJA248-18]